MIVYTENDAYVFRDYIYNDAGLISFFLEVNSASDNT